MRKQGQVIAVESGDVVIRSQRESSCGSCAGQSACGTLGSWDAGKKERNQYDIRLPNILHAKVGDVVTVEVPDRLILTASMMFYGLPVLAFLMLGALGFLLAEQMGLSGDIFSAIGGLIGAFSVWIWLMRRAGVMQIPQMVAIEREESLYLGS